MGSSPWNLLKSRVRTFPNVGGRAFERGASVVQCELWEEGNKTLGPLDDLRRMKTNLRQSCLVSDPIALGLVVLQYFRRCGKMYLGKSAQKTPCKEIWRHFKDSSSTSHAASTPVATSTSVPCPCKERVPNSREEMCLPGKHLS